jgi:hypothetical protein
MAHEVIVSTLISYIGNREMENKHLLVDLSKNNISMTLFLSDIAAVTASTC